eukprot:10684286-Alexandrium_andersonii.AAC.1
MAIAAVCISFSTILGDDPHREAALRRLPSHGLSGHIGRCAGSSTCMPQGLPSWTCPTKT